MDDMKVELAKLATAVEHGFISVNRRLDEHGQALTTIAGETRHTNGRVTRHDEQIRTLFRRAEERDRAKDAGPKDKKDKPSSEDRPYTKRDVAIFVAGTGSALALLKLIAMAAVVHP
jgi:hypothetical protein